LNPHYHFQYHIFSLHVSDKVLKRQINSIISNFTQMNVQAKF
jgi:hypothetical protein